MMQTHPSIVLMGAGKMGLAMLRGWRQAGLVGKNTRAIDPAPSDEARALCAEAGVSLHAEINAPDTQQPDVLVLAIKPQILDSAAAQIAELAGPRTLVISILAGKSIADLAARAPRASAIIRAMPNMPAAIGEGVSGACASPQTNQAQRALADKLLSSVGPVLWLTDERLMDAVTAVSGSGPAYVFLLVESLAKAGVDAGLPAEVALRLARATLVGASELMRRNPEIGLARLRADITSPGGTTEAALKVLMAEDGLDALMGRAVAAAIVRAQALSG